MVRVLTSSKSKFVMARNQNNVSEWRKMFTHGQLFQWTCTIKIQLSMFVLCNAYILSSHRI